MPNPPRPRRVRPALVGRRVDAIIQDDINDAPRMPEQALDFRAFQVPGPGVLAGEVGMMRQAPAPARPWGAAAPDRPPEPGGVIDWNGAWQPFDPGALPPVGGGLNLGGDPPGAQFRAGAVQDAVDANRERLRQEAAQRQANGFDPRVDQRAEEVRLIDRLVSERQAVVRERVELQTRRSVMNAEFDREAGQGNNTDAIMSRINDITVIIMEKNSRIHTIDRELNQIQRDERNQANLLGDVPAGQIIEENNAEYVKCTVRGEATPRFFIVYASLEEYNLRLRGSFISYKGSPVHVTTIGTNGRGMVNQMLVTDIRGKTIIIDMLKDVEHLDSRSFAPGYIGQLESMSNSAAYLCRVPARVYKQGICNENSHLRFIDGSIVNLNMMNVRVFMKALESRAKPQEFSVELLKDVTNDAKRYASASRFLSTNFALGAFGKEVGIYYRDHRISVVGPDGQIDKKILARVPSSLHTELHQLKIA